MSEGDFQYGFSKTSLAQLQNKIVVFVGRGDLSKKFIFEIAKECGVKTVVVDSEHAPWLDGLLHAEIIVSSANDHCSAIEAKELLQQKNIKPDAVLTFWEPEVECTAQLATALGCLTNTPQATENARSKILTRQLMRAAGLPSPNSILVSDHLSLEQAIENIGDFPCIFKPNSGYNSFNTFKVCTPDEARHALAEVLELSNDKTRFDSLMWEKKGIEMLLETYLDGVHVDVDVLIDHGECAFHCVTLEIPSTLEKSLHPSFVTPATIDKEKEQALVDLALKTLKCLGLTQGAFNIELKYTDTNPGPYVIEVNGRMGGAFLAHLFRHSLGVCFVRGIMLLACGIPIMDMQKVTAPIQFVCGGNCYGKLKDCDYLRNLPSTNQNVLLTLCTFDAERNITMTGHGKYHNCGWVLAKGDTMNNAIANCDSAIQSCMVPYDKVATALEKEMDPRKLMNRPEKAQSIHTKTQQLFKKLRAVLSKEKGATIQSEKEQLQQIIQQFLAEQSEPNGTKATPAAEFPVGADWFNVAAPLRLDRELRGKIVLLDFWTYCCVNCMHVLPYLAKLEAKYEHQPEIAFIGVHAGKFEAERDSENILNSILRHDVEHAVVNDGNMQMLEDLNVTAYPTFVILGPYGNVLAQLIDDDDDDGLHLTNLFLETASLFYSKSTSLNKTPINMKLEKNKVNSDSPLRYPGKITVDSKSSTLFIADTANNRIVQTDLSGNFIKAFGNGAPGFKDGTEPMFDHPNGLLVLNDYLYVADTENHAIRKVEIATGATTTIVGTGARLLDPRTHDTVNDAIGSTHPTKQACSSPWDLCYHAESNSIFIGVVGIHQIWRYYVETNKLERYSGNGAEMNLNTDKAKGINLLDCGWAQPSGLSYDDKTQNLFIADSESSSIRAINVKDATSTTLAGGTDDASNLWVFGDKLGRATSARFQHPMAVCWCDKLNAVIVADSYNHKVKLVDVNGNTTRLFDSNEKELFEPSGLCIHNNLLFIADSNNHAIKVLDLESRKLASFTLTNVPLVDPSIQNQEQQKLAKQAEEQLEQQRKKQNLTEVDAVVNQPSGTINITLKVVVPSGFHFTPGAPSKWTVTIPADQSLALSVDNSLLSGNIAAPENNGFVTIPVSYKLAENINKEATAAVDIKVHSNFCQDSGFCSFNRANFRVNIKTSTATSDNNNNNSVVPLEVQLQDPTWRPMFHPVAFKQLGLHDE